MSVSIKEVATLLPFQISTMATMVAVMMSKDFPEHSAELFTLPVTGMVLGAALIASVCYSRVRRERNEEKRFSGEVQRFIAGEA